MPADFCCDYATSITRLLDVSTDSQVKTTAYLTIEVLYASRRLDSFGDHTELTLKHLIENPELADVTDSVEAKQEFSFQRVVAFMQATAQVALNLSSNPDTSKHVQS